jgi:hypothetical protein
MSGGNPGLRSYPKRGESCRLRLCLAADAIKPIAPETGQHQVQHLFKAWIQQKILEFQHATYKHNKYYEQLQRKPAHK